MGKMIITVIQMRKIVQYTGLKNPTKIFLGLPILLSLKEESLSEGLFSSLFKKGKFMGMEIETKDSFGRFFPITYIGMC